MNLYSVFNTAFSRAFPFGGRMSYRDFMRVAGVMEDIRPGVPADEWYTLVLDEGGMTGVLYTICGRSCDLAAEYPAVHEALSGRRVRLEAEDLQMVAEEAKGL